jgi:NhaP-type Na+/H+ or K+/H+ antiporter
MEHAAFQDPALTIALAAASGMLAQTIARHVRIPGIVLLLATGLLLGPDGLGVVRPGTLGASLHSLIGFAVAVILFEGGMNLSVDRLRREARSIRQLVTLGALVTAAGATVAARLILGWTWEVSILFGTLVIVTGPTVITPLLRRIKVKERVATVLEAEGILGDAIGAITAVVALEVVISPDQLSFATGALPLLSRLGSGTLLGVAGGLAIVALLRFERLVPEGLESALTLALVIALFQGSNALMPETGILSVIVAGIVVGNSSSRVLVELREFKEQLTVLLLGMLFVLLAADVRVAEVRSLGWAGVATVLALMFIVRPLNILAGTLGSDLTWREKGFLSWLAPRGIVAAAVSSLFAQTLAEEGIAGGDELRAMVFLVIAATVVVQGLTGGIVASWLGLRRPSNTGYVILGANALARAVGRALRLAGEEVVLIDSNQAACDTAEAEGFRALHGSGLEPDVQERAELDTRAGCLGLTSNEEVNLLFARRCRKDFKVPRVWVAVRRSHLGVSQEVVRRLGGYLLFGEPEEILPWTRRLESGEARVKLWIINSATSFDGHLPNLDGIFLPLVFQRGKRAFPLDETVTLRPGDRLYAAVVEGRRQEITEGLQLAGWERASASSDRESW